MSKSAEVKEPRISAPDLPKQLADEKQPTLRGDHYQVEFSALSENFDASYAALEECRIGPARVNEVTFRGATFTDVQIDGLTATHFAGRETAWRNVRIDGGRIAALDLPNATVNSVCFTKIRIDYLNLSGATISDVSFVDCRFGTVDIVDSKVNRISFTGCSVEELDARGSRLQNLDLRDCDVDRFVDVISLKGVTMNAHQVAQHSVAFAKALGLDVRD